MSLWPLIKILEFTFRVFRWSWNKQNQLDFDIELKIQNEIWCELMPRKISKNWILLYEMNFSGYMQEKKMVDNSK